MYSIILPVIGYLTIIFPKSKSANVYAYRIRFRTRLRHVCYSKSFNVDYEEILIKLSEKSCPVQLHLVFSKSSNLLWVLTETSSLASPDLPGKQHSVFRNFATSVWKNGSSCWTNTINASISFMVLSLLRISLTGIWCADEQSAPCSWHIQGSVHLTKEYFYIINLRIMNNFFFTSYVCLFIHTERCVIYPLSPLIPDLSYRSISSWIWRGRVYHVKNETPNYIFRSIDDLHVKYAGR